MFRRRSQPYEGYGCEWDYDFRNKRFLAEDNTKFGVNIIMYALSALAGAAATPR